MHTPTTCRHSIFLQIALLAVCSSLASSQDFSLGTEFAYQGRLDSQGLPAQGRFDFEFALFDGPTGGALLGRVQHPGLDVNNGVFSTALDFGEAVFTDAGPWIEIAVRGADQTDYTVLAPRQRLSGGTGSTCAVSGNLEVGGSVGIGIVNPSAKLHVGIGTDVTGTTGGSLLLGGSLGTLAFDSNEIQARSFGGPGALGVNSNGGKVMIGDTTDNHVEFNGQQIQGRDGNNLGILELVGDPIQMIGTVGIGYLIATGNFAPSPSTVICPFSLRVLGGGCIAPSGIQDSFPTATGNGWTCHASSGSATAYAICANVD